MEMKIDKLVIQNFKGIDHFELNLSGESAVVYGQNGTGKSTVADAWYWLFAGYNYDQKSNFNIITLDPRGKPLDRLEAQVEAVIYIGSRVCTLKKIYRQKWSRKKGSVEEQMIGHTTDHFIDEEPVTRTQYNDSIAAIIDPEIFKCLSNPVHFASNTSVAFRRKLLFEIAGSVSDDQIFDLNDHLAPLRDTLSGTSHDAYRKIAKHKFKLLDNKLKEIPGIIKGLRESYPDTCDLSEDDLKKRIAEIDEKISEKKNDTEYTKNLKRIALLETELVQIENDLRNKSAKIYESKLDEQRKILNDINKLKIRLNEKDTQLLQLKNALDLNESEKKSLSEKGKEVHYSQFPAQSKCFNCGQDLPEIKIVELKSNFNLEKAKNLKQINEQGEKLFDKSKKLKEKIAALETAISNLEYQIASTQKLYNGIDSELSNVEIDLTKDIVEKKKKIQKQIQTLEQKNDLSVFPDQIAALESEKTDYQNKLLDYRNIEKIDLKIERHEKSLKETASAQEDIESIIFLLDDFEKIKVRSIETKVNDYFDITDWRLFEVMQNGNLKDICEAMYNGIPFNSDLNTGSKINSGLDIINVLSKHLKKSCPIFIDNAESVTEWIFSDNQIIKLNAVEGERKLNVYVRGGDEYTNGGKPF